VGPLPRGHKGKGPTCEYLSIMPIKEGIKLRYLKARKYLNLMPIKDTGAFKWDPSPP